MNTLINNNGKWVGKLGEDMLIWKLHCYYCCVDAKSLCFHPLSCIINNTKIYWFLEYRFVGIIDSMKSYPHFFKRSFGKIVTNLVRFYVNRLLVL
jgi:hypothetical protein